MDQAPCVLNQWPTSSKVDKGIEKGQTQLNVVLIYCCFCGVLRSWGEKKSYVSNGTLLNELLLLQYFTFPQKRGASWQDQVLVWGCLACQYCFSNMSRWICMEVVKVNDCSLSHMLLVSGKKKWWQENDRNYGRQVGFGERRVDLRRLKCFCCSLKEVWGGRRWEGSFFWESDVLGTKLLQVFGQEVRLNSGGNLCGVKGPISIFLVLLIQLVLPNCFPLLAEQVLMP